MSVKAICKSCLFVQKLKTTKDKVEDEAEINESKFSEKTSTVKSKQLKFDKTSKLLLKSK